MNGRFLSSGGLILVAVVGSVTAGRGAAQQATSAPPVAASSAAARPPAVAGPAALYNSKCGVCHAPGSHPGYLALKQLGQPEPDLAKRTDLDPDYVKAVVRNGAAQMPALTAGYVGERDLDMIAAYLAKRK